MSSVSAVFVGKSVTHADVDSRDSRTTVRSWCSTNGKNQAKIAFFLLFWRRKFWHDFVTPFSTCANIKGSLSTNLTTPDRLRCRARPSDDFFPVFGQFFFRTSPKKGFFSRPASSCDPHPKRSPCSPIFVTGGTFFARQMLEKKMLFSGRRACSAWLGNISNASAT